MNHCRKNIDADDDGVADFMNNKDLRLSTIFDINCGKWGLNDQEPQIDGYGKFFQCQIIPCALRVAKIFRRRTRQLLSPVLKAVHIQVSVRAITIYARTGILFHSSPGRKGSHFTMRHLFADYRQQELFLKLFHSEFKAFFHPGRTHHQYKLMKTRLCQ